jgi:iron complex transport system permease protein
MINQIALIKSVPARRQYLLLGFLFLLLVVAFFLDLFLGSVKIPFRNIINIFFDYSSEREEWTTIVLEFRLPKALTALLAGIALSISGLQMQTVFRNPLAGPYVLGISAGASLGVAILVLGFSSYFVLGNLQHLGNWAIVIAACLGSSLILLLIMTVSLRVSNIMTILILGIMFGSATTALVSILQYFSTESMLKAFIIWTMGSLGSVSDIQLNILMICVLLGSFTAFFSSKMLNALLLGEKYAKSIGLNIKLSRIIVFTSTSILAGSVTAFCGPIGFIGIAVPHIARMAFKTSDHQVLLAGTVVTGSLMLLISDVISQLPGYERILPINSVTALLGIPVIIWIIIRKRKGASFM